MNITSENQDLSFVKNEMDLKSEIAKKVEENYQQVEKFLH